MSAETIGKVESLEGWQIVDMVDGRRWLGRVVAQGVDADPRRAGAELLALVEGAGELGVLVKTLYLATAPDLVTLDPAFELLPQRHGLVIAPRMGADRSGVPSVQGLAPSWMIGPARDNVGILQLPTFASYTGQRAGFVDCASLSRVAQEGLLASLNDSIRAVERGIADDKRGRPRLVE